MVLVAGCGFFPMKVLSLKEGAAVMKAGTPRTIANCPGAAVRSRYHRSRRRGEGGRGARWSYGTL